MAIFICSKYRIIRIYFSLKYRNPPFQCDRKCNLWKKHLGECSSPHWNMYASYKNNSSWKYCNLFTKSEAMYTITLYWAISIQSEFIMPATFRKMGLIKFNLAQTLHKREIHPKFQIFVMLGFYIRWKHLSLPHSCQCLGYIMMYSKWLNYFPIFSSRKAIWKEQYQIYDTFLNLNSQPVL